MKTLSIIIISTLLFVFLSFSSSQAQDIFGRANPKLKLIYVGKYEMPDTIFTTDSSVYYSGGQGGNRIYSPYKLIFTHSLYDGPGTYRIEYAGGPATLQDGYLPFFMNNSEGLHVFVQSNSPECDCKAYGTKILRQMDIHVKTYVAPYDDGHLKNNAGCIFTLFVYWYN